MVAALFALHPINVESVAWAAERKNVLSMMFFLLALWAYIWYTRSPRPQRYACVVGLYALALMAKPQVITFPFLLWLWDYWPLGRIGDLWGSAPRSQDVEAGAQRSVGGSQSAETRVSSPRPTLESVIWKKSRCFCFLRSARW